MGLAQKIALWTSVILLLVAIPILLVGVIQFILYDSGFQFIFLGSFINIFGFCLMICVREEARRTAEIRRKRKEEKRKKRLELKEQP